MDGLGEKIQSLLSDPESMRNLSELAAMLRQPEERGAPEQPQETPPPDLAKLMAVGQAVSQCGSDDTEKLILALQPYLSAERAARAGKAVKLLHLWHIVSVLRETGVIGELI